MIFTDKSVSVVIALRDCNERLKDILAIWAVSISSYQDGAEIILVDRQKDEVREEIIADFMEEHKNSGIRVVYIPKEVGKQDYRIGTAYNLALKQVKGSNILFADGRDFPNGKILNNYRHMLEQGSEVIAVGTFEHVKAPYDYSLTIKEFATYSPGYAELDKNTEPWEYCGQGNFVIPTHAYKYLESIRSGELFLSRTTEDFETLMEFAHFAYENGYKFRAVSEAAVFRSGKKPANRRVRSSWKNSSYLSKKFGGGDAGFIKSGGPSK